MSHYPTLSELSFIVFDFDGVFTDNRVNVNSLGHESVSCNRGDGLAIRMLNRAIAITNSSVCPFILSTESNPVVAYRSSKMNLNCFQGIDNKYHFLQNHYSGSSLGTDVCWSRTLYVGNDLNDLQCIQAAGFSVCPSDSHYLVKSHSSIVNQRPGGDLLVRSVVEEVLRLSDLSSIQLSSLLT